MTNKTRRGIYYDINDSEYSYKFKNTIFFFTSQSYLNKFEERLPEYIITRTKELNHTIRFKIDWSRYEELMALELYKQIETRGVRYEKIK